MASSNSDLSDSVTDFTLDVYKHVAGSKPDKNLFMSPSSMMVVMTMVHVGATNNTESQMTQVLKYHKMNKDDVLQSMQKFVSTLQTGSKSVILKTANRLYPNIGNEILQEYISVVRKHFSADVKPMDFNTKFEEARQEINSWVEEETNTKIKNLLPGGSLNSLTRLVIVNAIYFKGNWATQFDPKNTEKRQFTKLNAEKVHVDMMYRRMKSKHAEDGALHCQVLELPYEGNELGMIVVLPDKHDGLPALEKKLTLKSLSSLVTSLHPGNVDISLPKFKLESSLELKDVLSTLGMPEAFSDSADLSRMGKDLYISEVFHKAFVDVNEEGTEAAAATGAVIKTRSIQIVPRFTADHPFLFMIWDHRLQVPLFIGRFMEPVQGGGGMMQQTRDEL